MRTHIIKLGGEDFELLGSFDNWDAVEKIAGKVYAMAGRISASDLGLCDVVNIYHIMQHKSAKSQQDIIDAVFVEGLGFHLEEVIRILTEIMSGGNKGESGKK